MTRSLTCISAALLLLSSCGDDTSGGTTADAAPMMRPCPSDGVPNAEGLSGACCYRQSNADRLDQPEFRISRLRLDGPGILGTTLVFNLLRESLNEELFNWLIRLDGASADGSVSITTGFGHRNEDSSFSFANGTAPEPGDPDRWNPGSANGTLTGETLTDAALEQLVTVPILKPDSTDLQLELPLQALVLTSMTMSEDRTCVGLYNGEYDTMQGTLYTFITLEDALIAMVDSPPIVATLCNLLAGSPAGGDRCGTAPRTEWDTPPNSLCDDSGCTEDPGDSSICTIDTCNAWRLSGGFAAHGVEIND